MAEFALDSPLEGDGSELSVRERIERFRRAASLCWAAIAALPSLAFATGALARSIGLHDSGNSVERRLANAIGPPPHSTPSQL
jgi:hypothetical protein